MFDILINLLVQIFSGAVGGNLAGSIRQIDLGTTGNVLSGAVGGAVGGQLGTVLLPMLANATTDVGAMVGQLAVGGIGGAVLTAIVGFVVNFMDGGSRPATS